MESNDQRPRLKLHTHDDEASIERRDLILSLINMFVDATFVLNSIMEKYRYRYEVGVEVEISNWRDALGHLLSAIIESNERGLRFSDEDFDVLSDRELVGHSIEKLERTVDEFEKNDVDGFAAYIHFTFVQPIVSAVENVGSERISAGQTEIDIVDGNVVRKGAGATGVTGCEEKKRMKPEDLHSDIFRIANDYANCREEGLLSKWTCAFFMIMALADHTLIRLADITTIVQTPKK